MPGGKVVQVGGRPQAGAECGGAGRPQQQGGAHVVRDRPGHGLLPRGRRGRPDVRLADRWPAPRRDVTHYPRGPGQHQRRSQPDPQPTAPLPPPRLSEQSLRVCPGRAPAGQHILAHGRSYDTCSMISASSSGR